MQLESLSKIVKELEEESKKKEKHFPLRECSKIKKPKGGQNEEVLSLILCKIVEEGKVLNEMNENIKMLNHMRKYHSMII